MIKIRLDAYLLQQGLCENINIAQSLIIQGKVLIDQRPVTKVGTQVAVNANNITIKQASHDYVSRGALKLVAALEHFSIDTADLICLDVGSSTGGFTEVLLRRKAQMVFAVDVGYGELHYKLRNNPCITVIERTNARYLTTQQITVPPDLIVCDASFISLKTILPTPMTLAKENCLLIALIKPQFEVEKHEVGPRGIITDPALHDKVCRQIHQWLEFNCSFKVQGVLPSPILGAKGNKEFLIYAQRSSFTKL